MAIERPTQADMQQWGRELRAHKGAFGTGLDGDDEPPFGLSMVATIPVSRRQVEDLWRAGNLDTTLPQSGWHTLQYQEAFGLSLTTHRLQEGPSSPAGWLTAYGVVLGDLKDAGRREIAGIGHSNTRTIEDTFALVERLLRGEWPLVSIGEARSGVSRRAPEAQAASCVQADGLPPP